MTTNETRRDVMANAWAFFRADASRTFGQALASAWRWVKGRAARAADNAAWARRNTGRTVAFGSLIASPIRRAMTGPYAGERARSAGYVTSAVGR